MHEILGNLSLRDRILDLGSGRGSFESSRAWTVRLDLDPEAALSGGVAVISDAADLPFRNDVFKAVISNHSLEHVEGLDRALSEIGRVLMSDGALFVSVPDAGSCADRLYRWLGSGGGHVNFFTDPLELARGIESATGLETRAIRTLHSSLSFLNSRNPSACPPRKARFSGLSNEAVLRWLSLLTRLLDRYLGTRTSIYGWALYFGEVSGTIDIRAWSNVCIRCGCGYPDEWLLLHAKLRRGFWTDSYWCPACGARNFLARDNSRVRRL